MAQEILVGAIVLFAAAVSVWKLMPARRRLVLLTKLDAWAARRPAFAGARARWIRPRLERAAGPGCSGCSVAPTRRAMDDTPTRRVMDDTPNKRAMTDPPTRPRR